MNTSSWPKRSDGSGRPKGCTPDFPTTNWADVTAGGGPDLERRKEALERLLPRYWPALEAHVQQRFGLTAEDLADALQDFALDKMLIANVLAEADQARGKFRTFLPAVLILMTVAT